MPQLRKDPIVDQWVVVAAERGHRPTDFKPEAEPPSGGFCPFCPGNENRTPPEIMAIGRNGTAPDTPGWKVRVIPNKFPALAIEGGLNRQGYGMFDMMNGVGAHEVIVESPDHQWHLAEAPLEEIRDVFVAYRERILDLQRDPRFRYSLVFRNYGLRAGASLAHPHSQLISIAVMPRRVKDELKAARDYFAHKERCIFCDIINQEMMLNERVVAQNEHFIALSPFAARFPYELNVFPRRHRHDYTRMNDEEIWGLAHIMRNVLKRVKETLNNPAYNFMLHTAPYPNPRPGRPEYWGTIELDFHWHIEIVPRLTRVAGFEWGTGFYINPVAPEASTQVLREVEIKE